MNQAPSRLAYLLLLAMSLVSFGGPFLVMLVMAGGEHRRWPPDRPIEWVVFSTVVGLAAFLLLVCLTIRLWLPRMTSTKHEPRPNTDR